MGSYPFISSRYIIYIPRDRINYQLFHISDWVPNLLSAVGILYIFLGGKISYHLFHISDWVPTLLSPVGILYIPGGRISYQLFHLSDSISDWVPTILIAAGILYIFLGVQSVISYSIYQIPYQPGFLTFY